MARILVIDDSKTTMAFVRATFEPDGHEVIHLQSFVSVVGVLEETPPDVILLDLDMPCISGAQIGRTIRTHQCSPIPVIIFSSEPSEVCQQAADEIGAVSVIKKTRTSPDNLRFEVTKALVKAEPSEIGDVDEASDDDASAEVES